jgi:hypothetical protein
MSQPRAPYPVTALLTAEKRKAVSSAEYAPR